MNSLKEHFGCPVVTDELPSDLLQALKALSNQPIIKVPIRQTGITSGEQNCCFWNASIISQTFGGKPIYGWFISAPTSEDELQTYQIVGHGNWLTPEGKLVDVTKRDRDSTEEENKISFRYFLPSDEQLVLNGTHTEQIGSFVYCLNEKAIEGELGMKAWCIAEIILRSRNAPTEESEGINWIDFYNPNSLQLGKYVRKIIFANAFPSNADIISALRKHWGNKYDESTLKNLFAPFVQEVTSSFPRKFTSRSNGVHLERLIDVALKTGKGIFEANTNYDVADAFITRQVEPVWNSRIWQTPVSGISTATGKSITQIPPLKEVVESHQLPRKKAKKRKLEKIASKTNLNPQEVLMLSNPFLFPHPYLTKKNSFKKVQRV